jgi:hypothetical protein
MRQYESTAEAPKETGFTSILGQIDNQIDNARKLVERARQCADRINGSAPTPVAQHGSARASASALIADYGDRISEIDGVLSEIGLQLSRIERVL